MKLGNVLVIGNSGVGKSTLINAVLGENIAKTGYGSKGSTQELEVYESDNVPFRIIDSVGFEPSLIKERMAINAVKKWSKVTATDDDSDNDINIIWFCVDGTASKLFPNALKNLSRATSIWDSVPLVVVITKSYSQMDRTKNIDMVNNVFAQQKKYGKNLKKVIPVVAETFVLNESAFAAPEGISELIDVTNDLMPEGLKAAVNDIASFKLNRKRYLSQGVVGIATTSAVAVGAIPLPFPDATLLIPIETLLINSLSKIYQIKKSDDSSRFIKQLVELGTVGLVAKNILNYLKAIPGLNIGAIVLNSIVAGTIVAAIGESSIYACEQVSLGKKSLLDLDWLKDIYDEKATNELLLKVKEVALKTANTTDLKEITKIILDIFTNKSK